MSDFEFTLDGETIYAETGDTILEAAGRAGVEIPTLCHDSRLDPAGACRTCLVEIEGVRRLVPACATAAKPDMAVGNSTERVTRHRDVLLSLYMSDHEPVEKPVRANELEHMAHAHTLLPLESIRAPRADRPKETNPYLTFDPALCILCGRCTRYCDEVEAANAITLSERGAATTIATAGQVSLLDTTCELCGGCVDTCPTGALFETKAATKPTDVEKVRTTCNYCGVGCQFDINVAGGKVVKITSPDPGTTLNDGNLCVKGRFAYDFIDHSDRLQTPLVRDAQGVLQPVTWPEALEAVSKGLLGVKARHGADALGFVSSSRCTGEENYLMQKLARAAFGTNNCHQCAAT
jgi:predicted molibdopterin-dependent oxidoreductase YjgC